LAFPDSVAIYERFSDLLWERVDPSSAEQEARGSRELVITFNCWIGNYIYGLSWAFRQDGSLEAQVHLAGTLLLRGVAANHQGDQFGTLVANYLSAPSHQHFFNFRLDFDVDGPSNSTVEINTRTLPPGSENPFGNAFVAEETLLQRESEAQRDLNLETHRTWKVINPSVTNSLGHHTGYALRPSDSAIPYALPQNSGRQRAGFVEHQVWVTNYDPDQMYATGQYPYQGHAGQGLPEFTADNADLVDRDIVLWYTIGATHHPEVEEYPVMPVQRIGFKLTPDGFFSRSPVLDVPALPPRVAHR
jgi:primary-amine oxidase